MKTVLYTSVIFFITSFGFEVEAQDFHWPDGKSIALSLSFDDARQSHPTTGRDLFRRIGGKASFYVVPSAMQLQLDGWKDLVSDGHEIGNHTLHHPCTGNFDWSKDHALEQYSLHDMRQELLEANHQISAMLGVTPRSFAYTCGQTFVSRGINQQSYVPLVAELFESGRGWMNEAFNDPLFADHAMLQGNEMDGKDFKKDILPMIEEARQTGKWLLLAGHEIGEDAHQTVNISMLEELMAYLDTEGQDIWLGTVSEINTYIKQQKKKSNEALAKTLLFATTFDQGIHADFATGDPFLYSIPAYDKPDLISKGFLPAEVTIAKDQGLSGHALEFKRKGRSAIFYKAQNNINAGSDNWEGTISLWLSLDPEEDLAPGYTDPIQITDSGYDDAAFWVDFTKENPRSFRMGIYGDVDSWNPDKIGPDENPAFQNRLVPAADRPFSRDRWTHVVISYSQLNSDGGQASFFINGNFQGRTMIPEPFTWELDKAKIFLGLNFVGLVDEVSIFSTALSAQEIKGLYQLPNGIQSLVDVKSK